MMRPRLHGTDGIRGRIEPFDGDDVAALNALIEQRILSNRAMRIIGEATGLFLVDDVHRTIAEDSLFNQCVECGHIISIEWFDSPADAICAVQSWPHHPNHSRSTLPDGCPPLTVTFGQTLHP
jgi:hypothetical protein